MVTTIVNMPQALSFRALTTTIATPARVATMMKSVAMVVAMPAMGPSRLRAIFGSDRPLKRTEATRTTKSCTPPARQAPMMIQVKPGKNPHWAASTGPIERPRPGDRGEVDAKQHQSPRGLVVDVVAEPMRGGDILVVQHGHAGGQKGPIEPIGHRERPPGP